METRQGQSLSHYRLIEKIGEGGMGVVWRAEDTVLGRTVAIKVLPADVARDEARRQMFLDEARLASTVSDARIVQVYQLGREGDLDFIAMEFVEGQPLDRILHGRPLPPDKVAALGLQVARALSRAHRKGLLHRDVKPANVLVTPDGEVKLVDFGLATLFAPPKPVASSDPTAPPETSDPDGDRPGAARAGRRTPAGTLPYMAPEQVRGEAIDARSDVYSLGVMLYEMTTGQRPFAGATSSDLLEEILKSRPKPVYELVPKVPIELNRIVQKAIAPRAGDRYQTMEDLAVDLKRLERELETGSSPSYDDLKEKIGPGTSWPPIVRIIGVALVAVALGVGVWKLWPWRGLKVDEHAILVLPFEVRGQTEGADYVGRAFAEAIAVGLSQAQGLRVLPVPPEAADAQKDPLGRVRLAKQLGARWLLTGALTREEGTVRASLNLIDPARNQMVSGWEESENNRAISTLAFQMARLAGAQLSASFPTRYEALENLGLDSPLRGTPELTQALIALKAERLPDALPITERLLGAHPLDRDALVLRAWALTAEYELSPTDSSAQALDKILEMIDRADPKNPYSDRLRLRVLAVRDRNADGIQITTRILVREDLSDGLRADVLSARAMSYSRLGDHEAAKADCEEALRLEPANHFILSRISRVLLYAGRKEDALAVARQAVALTPDRGSGQVGLGVILSDLGRVEEAIGPLERAFALAPGQVNGALYATGLRRAGRIPEAREIATRAAAMSEDSRGVYNLACFWAVDGDPERALRMLRRALDLGYASVRLYDDPDFASLHDDPRFKAMVREIEEKVKTARESPRS